MTLYIHQSTIKAWRRCHRLYHYRYVEKIQQRVKRIQLMRGTIIGQCLDLVALEREKINTPGSWRGILSRYGKQYAKLFDEEKEYYGDLLGDIENIVSRYIKLYEKDGLKYWTSSKVTTPYELPIEIDLSPGVVFRGHIDKMPRDKQSRYWVMDHKSHKKIPEAEKRFNDLQLVFYFWAAPLAGYPKPSGVLWDYLRTKIPTKPEILKSGELSQRKDIDTDYETYYQEIVKHGLDPAKYHDLLSRLKSEGQIKFFQRVFLPGPSKALVKEIVNDAKITAQEIKHLAGKSKTRTMDNNCPQCEFYKLCTAELRGLDSDFIRKSEYVEAEDRWEKDDGEES